MRARECEDAPAHARQRGEPLALTPHVPRALAVARGRIAADLPAAKQARCPPWLAPAASQPTTAAAAFLPLYMRGSMGVNPAAPTLHARQMTQPASQLTMQSQAAEGSRTIKSEEVGKAIGGGMKRSRAEQEAALYQRAAELRLCGPLGDTRDDEWRDARGVDGRGAGAGLVDELRQRVKQRIIGNMDMGRVHTAVTWFADFLRDSSREPFVPLKHAGDLAAGVYNAETLDLFAEYMSMRGPRRASNPSEKLTADYIQTCVSTVRLLRSAETHYAVLVEGADTASSAIYKNMRKEQGPRGERRESRGFRARDFRTLIGKAYDRSSTAGRKQEWAIALTAHNLMLRGGEVGRCGSKPFDPARDLTLASIVLMEPCADSRWRPWLIVWVVSIKDGAMRFRAVPLGIAQRQDPTDPLCAYSALYQHWRARCAAVPACQRACAWCRPKPGAPRPGGKPPASCQRARAPLFVTDAGGEYCTDDVRALGRRMAEAAGIPSAAVGGKLWRIGGATDCRDMLGVERGQRTMKDRGRWGTDVAFVYSRSLVRDQLDASTAVGDADAQELEAVISGWVQPSSFR